ncbi:MAG TPA: hypothetical protein VFM98_08825 [Ramlibacter sp.]|uniref:hypothetical protein n=1 Tax=Ramlibacter sp. TaxID=1917967 RepID=UPI002D7EBF74|nr:hypothetical protein [Ramlibacter sp.]HET8745696.1 hypothetical protein [Ramlibacter sp.]
MRIALPVIATLTFSAASHGLAQVVPDGTYDVYQQEITVEGRLEGCSLVFTTITTDTAYSGGKQILLNGSIALRRSRDRDLVFTGKLGTRKLAATGPGVWEKPAHFHFFGATGTTAGHAQFVDAENEGYRLLLVRATEEDVMHLLVDMIGTAEFSVGFNRKPGGQDVTSKIRMNVSLQRGPNGQMRPVENPQTAVDYARCVSRVIDSFAQQLPSK